MNRKEQEKNSNIEESNHNELKQDLRFNIEKSK